MKASEFLPSIQNLNAGAERDSRIVAAAKAGGLVVWSWVEVPLDDERGFFRVASDYAAIGEPGDWVRVPVGGASAQAIADSVGAVLPSPYMVELVWRFAPVKLKPIEMNIQRMTSTAKFVEHNAKIESAREGRDGLIAGIKKDIVVSNKLAAKKGAVCIFGWHRLNGQPIQTISTKHEESYSDYSHGVRLVAPEMVLDGRTAKVQDVMRDPRVAAVLTGGKSWGQKHDSPNDGVLQVVRYGAQQPAPNKVVIDPLPNSSSPSSSSAQALGEAAIEWCLSELAAGVREEPAGSSTSPRIREYFAPARRRGTEARLGISKGDWCAVAQSAALAAVAKPGQNVPHRYRAAVRELREDAQQSGAWVPVSALRSGEYRLRRGDLLVWKRGNAGLGHVARVDVPGEQSCITVGANEENQWRRRERRLDDQELEGAISYSRFGPGLQLADNTMSLQASSSSAPAPVASTSTPAPDVDVWARGVVLRAWEASFPGKPITAAERQAIMAIGRFERMYGLAKKPAAGIGQNNWGGIQCASRGPCGPDCYPGGDKDAAGQGYDACFKRFATPEAGAKELIRQVTTRRPWVWDALRSGDLSLVAERMGKGGTVDGKWVGVYHESNPATYAGGLWRHANELAKALNENLAVRMGKSITPMSSSSSSTMSSSSSKPATSQSSAARNQPALGGSGIGMRAILASRNPALAQVIVGGGAPWERQVQSIEARLENFGASIDRLAADTADSDAAYDKCGPARTGAPLSPISDLSAMLLSLQTRMRQKPAAHTRAYASFATNTTVTDYAGRVNDYIDALHRIVAEARRSGLPNDKFPWDEWAAFRVSWDVLYFDLRHSLVNWFEDSIVKDYEDLARKWEVVIQQHYGKRPAVRPVTEEGLSGIAIAGLVGLGIGGVVLLTKAVG